MKLVVNLALSILMLAVCLWLVWPDPEEQTRILDAFRALDGDFLPYLFGFIALLAGTHFCRAWRWAALLEPLDVYVKPVPLLAISSAGFLAILALPARLGEFVRPALLRSHTHCSISTALGTVAVERVVDGVLVSILVFVTFLLHKDPSPTWMMPTAYLALAGFGVGLLFLLLARRNPQRTARIACRVLLIHRLAPRLEQRIEQLVVSTISGFHALGSFRHCARFVSWSLVYWTLNGFSMWLLARGFGLELPMIGAFATMGLLAIGITLPNAPVMAGQYQAFIVLGLSLYLGETAHAEGLAYAVILHVIQVIWYTLIGALSFATPYVSFTAGRVRALREPDPAVVSGQ